MAASVIGQRFEEVCRDRGGAVAVQTPSGGTTFADLAAGCAVIARALADFGVARGDAVISAVGNLPVFFAVVAACMEAGAALVPLGEATASETAALIEQAGAVAVITDRDLPLPVISERQIDAAVRLLRLADRDSRPRYEPAVVLKLTSGSTSLPKAAVASEMQIVNDGRHVIDAMGIAPADVNFTCIPLSHSYAIGNVVMPLLWQGTPVALRQSFNPAQFVRDVADSGATVFPGVPFMFERIMSHEHIDRVPASLRLLITAGASIDAGTVSWFKRTLDRKLHSFYGSSETGGIAYDDADELSDPLHVGRAMPETTVVLRPSARGPFASGVFVQGNAVASGYAHGQSHDVSSFTGGGFLTGDLGYLDDAGRLVLTGRVSPLVNVAGRKVDPAEVERRLLELPGIVDARVLGMACDQRGQEVVAVLVRTDLALTPLAIRQKCAETLSTHKIPRRFVFVDRFPVDARGKVDQRALESLVETSEAGSL